MVTAALLATKVSDDNGTSDTVDGDSSNRVNGSSGNSINGAAAKAHRQA